MNIHLFEPSLSDTVHFQPLPCQKVLNYQINGIGRLPKSQQKAPLLEAIKDAINSDILDEILPIGALPISTVNHIDSPIDLVNDTYHHASASHYAYKIKPNSLSPFDFIKSFGDSALTPVQRRVEALQIKQSFAELKEYFHSDEQFIQFINRSLANCAQQFAFCFIHRITHGRLFDNGLTIEGKWQNNCSTQFLSQANEHGDDITLKQSLEQQSEVAVSIFLKWVSYYNSFNNTEIETSPMLLNFEGLYRKYQEYYAISLLGLSPTQLPLNTSSRADLTDAITFLYSQRVNTEAITDFIIGHFIEERSTVMQDATDSDEQHYTALSLKVRSMVIALRKLYFSAILDQQSIEAEIKERTSSSINETNITSYAKSLRECAAWLYDKNDSLIHVVLFKNGHKHIYFVPITQSYVVEHIQKGHKYSFLNAKELSQYLVNQPKDEFKLPGFLAWQSLDNLVSVLIKLETNQLVEGAS